MAALFAFGGNEEPQGEEVAQEQEMEAAQVQKAPVKEPIKETIDTKEKVMIAPVAPQSAAETAELEDQFLGSEVAVEEFAEEIAEEMAEEMAEVSGGDVIAEGFSEGAILSLQWPVEGNVVLPFSMDSSVYFKTLAQYQYNPAMMISAAEGTEVCTSAAGTVTDVGKSNAYGHYVTMDIGDGFEITYGQLFDISTEVGETLEAGERIAMVAYPTRSFLEEGDNLYLKLTRNGVPVNPELYLE